MVVVALIRREAIIGFIAFCVGLAVAQIARINARIAATTEGKKSLPEKS